MFTAKVLEQVKFGKKKKNILLRLEHTSISVVYILRTLLVRPIAFRRDKTGVESLPKWWAEAGDIKAADI